MFAKKGPYKNKEILIKKKQKLYLESIRTWYITLKETK